MAVLDLEKIRKPYLLDRDEDVFIGLDFPFRIGYTGEGWGASTQTTLEATKNNIRNLVNTEQGERLMQPRLGLKLRRYLFEQITRDTTDQMRAEIVDAINYWLPFVQIDAIDVQESANQTGNFKHLIEIYIKFSLKKDPTTHESIQIKIGE